MTKEIVNEKEIDQLLETAVLAMRKGQIENGKSACLQILKRNPKHPHANHLLGVFYVKESNLENAINYMKISVENEKNNKNFYNNLATTLMKAGKFNESINNYNNALKIKSDYHEALSNLSAAYCENGEVTKAYESAYKAIKINPNYAEAYYNMAKILRIKGEYDEAVTTYKKAIELNKNYYEAYCSLGNTYREILKCSKAIDSYNEAIKINNNYADAHFNLSLVHLLQGNFDEGWKEYEWRFKTSSSEWKGKAINKPRWDGSEDKIIGKKLLIVSEQGFGDSIQFARYVGLISKKVKKIIFECDEKLEKLINDSFPTIETVRKPYNRDLNFDFYIPLLSLPFVFETNLSNIPSFVPYFKTKNDLDAKWKEKILSNKKKNVGIIWAGNPSHKKNLKRSLNFKYFEKLFNLDFNFYSLQIGKNSDDISETYRKKIINLSPKIRNFSDTASIMKNLDLIISVDTASAHLAGALNKKVWTILSMESEWRWMLNKNLSPWYPSMKLFRQKNIGEWQDVINDVYSDLKNE